MRPHLIDIRGSGLDSNTRAQWIDLDHVLLISELSFEEESLPARPENGFPLPWYSWNGAFDLHLMMRDAPLHFYRRSTGNAGAPGAEPAALAFKQAYEQLLAAWKGDDRRGAGYRYDAGYDKLTRSKTL